MADLRISGLSRMYPNPTLHLTQRRPRVLPVLWSWSMANLLELGFQTSRQIPHLNIWYEISLWYIESEIPCLDCLWVAFHFSGLSSFHCLVRLLTQGLQYLVAPEILSSGTSSLQVMHIMGKLYHNRKVIIVEYFIIFYIIVYGTLFHGNVNTPIGDTTCSNGKEVV